MESEANEFPKGLVLYGGGHVHIRHIIPSPLVDVGCYTTTHMHSSTYIFHFIVHNLHSAGIRLRLSSVMREREFKEGG
ncbi:hypothetical protein C1H46_045272 [Malus baccata]|uniref:Uncharacterized protein n=1 Tax=Malus baccata TaxID=106549 RepID=A0A540K4P1_MALBA|nr:hypothetical protein C1H46_045272 [Malus baccata]